MTWPTKFSLPFDEWFGDEPETAAAASTRVSARRKTPPSRGIVGVEIVEANDLMTAGAAAGVGIGRADPYVRVEVDGVVRRSTIERRTLSPVWKPGLNNFAMLVSDLESRVRLCGNQALGQVHLNFLENLTR